MASRRGKQDALRIVDPARAIHAIACAVGRDARRELVDLVVTAWVDAIPEHELAGHYRKALSGLAPEDLRELAGWPGTRGVAVAIPSREFLLGAFGSLGAARRDALRSAACLRGCAAFDAGVSERQVLDTVLPCLSRGQLTRLAREATELYLTDRLGTEN
jgi:hypothetical protein